MGKKKNWRIGVMECCSDGKNKDWRIGVLEKNKKLSVGVLQVRSTSSFDKEGMAGVYQRL
jgi:hypothetical protein